MAATTASLSLPSAVTDTLPEMPLLPISSAETIEACRKLTVSSLADVFVCSYPKSGTTWTQNIVVRLLWEIANDKTKTTNRNHKPNSNNPLPKDWHLSHSAPFYEVDQYWRKQNQSFNNNRNQTEEEQSSMERVPAKTPILATATTAASSDDETTTEEYRVFNTHLLPHQLPRNAKCVYVVRDPLDVMVSFYHHLSNQAVEDGGYTGSFEEFFGGFLDGTIVYGKWQDHIEAWLGRGEHRNNNNNNNHRDDEGRSFLLLHYEDMKKDLSKETKRLARFLLGDDDGEETCGKTDDAYIDGLVARVVPFCTFAAMKQERKRYTPLTVSWRTNPETGKPYDEFVRKGTVGDGRRFLLDTTTTSSSSSSPSLRDRWVNNDVPIAQARWARAGVDQKFIDRYL